MKKLNISFIDNGKKEDAVLKIKDDSFSITTNDNSIIKIPYTDIKDYEYTNDEELIIKRKHNSDIVIEVGFDTTLINTLKEAVESNNKSKPTMQEEIKKENASRQIKENVDKNTSNVNESSHITTTSINNQKTNGGAIVGAVLVICALIYGVYSIGSSIFGGSESSDGLSKDRSIWVDAGYYSAESSAKKDIPEDAYVWTTLKASELTCETIGVSNKTIVVVKCTTTNDKVIEHYGASTIYYAYQQSADGSRYWHYASKDRDEAIQKVK